jgi:hypothetical protein
MDQENTMPNPTLAPGRTPMMAPWLARKAGIPFERTEALWREALRQTAGSAPPDSPGYWKAAGDRWLYGIARESLRRRAAPFGLGPLLRLPTRLWLLGIDAAEKLTLASARVRRRWSW